MRDTVEYFKCECCQLSHPVTRFPNEFNNYSEQKLCRTCIEHRGVDDRMRVRRAEEHEAAMRTRWEAARAAASKMEEQRNSAFRSRDRAVRKLEALRDLHEYVGTRRACKCGVKDCKTLTALEDSWLEGRISDLRRRQYERGDWNVEGWEPYGINLPNSADRSSQQDAG